MINQPELLVEFFVCERAPRRVADLLPVTPGKAVWFRSQFADRMAISVWVRRIGRHINIRVRQRCVWTWWRIMDFVQSVMVNHRGDNFIRLALFAGSNFTNTPREWFTNNQIRHIDLKANSWVRF